MAATALVHRALASPVREELLTILRRDGGLVDVATLSHRLGLHHNTVRGHLAILERAGLIERTQARPDGPGRPRVLFRAAGHGDADDAYLVLAGILASYADDRRGAGEVVRHARGWGRRLVDGGSDGGRVSRAKVLDSVLVMLERLGFEPRIELAGPDGPSIEIDTCPLRAVAEVHPDIACAVHRGLTEGALEALGGQIEVIAQRPSNNDGPCVTRLGLSR